MCQFSQKLAMTFMMVSGDCQKHSKARTEGGREGGNASIAPLAPTLLPTASGAPTTKRRDRGGRARETKRHRLVSTRPVTWFHLSRRYRGGGAVSLLKAKRGNFFHSRRGGRVERPRGARPRRVK